MSFMRKLLYLAFTLIFILSLMPCIGPHILTPVQAASNWVKKDITFDVPQKYVLDCTVILDESTYKMWYTRVKSDMGLTDIFSSLQALDLTDILNALQNYQFNNLLSNLTDLSVPDIWGIVDGISTVIGYATSPDGKEWTVVNDNVIEGSSGGLWTSVGFPSVIKDPDTDEYKMWYTSAESTLTQTSLQHYLTDMSSSNSATRKSGFVDFLNSTETVIKYATSSDGESWTIQGTPALSGTGGTWNAFDSVGAPSVVRADDTNYMMWYTRFETDFDSTALDNILTEVANGTVDTSDLIGILDSSALVIGYATSSDGTSFTVQDDNILPGTTSPALWESALDPCVIMDSATDYDMWYTNGTTDLIQSTLRDVLDEIVGFNLPDLWASMSDLDTFITDLTDKNLTAFKNLLSSTTGVIGHATSEDGTTWTVKDALDMAGTANTPWSSVSTPSVLKTSSTLTKMWFSKGIDDFDYQELFDRIITGEPSLGYAYASSGGIFGGFFIPVPGVTDVIPYVNFEGFFQQEVTVYSDDRYCYLFIPDNTLGLTKDGKPLYEISMLKMSPQPEMPPDIEGIDLFYDLGPDDITFDPPVTIYFSYENIELPEGTNEEDLTVVWADKDGNWHALESTVDLENKIVSAEISHFTPYGVVIPSPTVSSFTISDLTVFPYRVEVNQTATISALVTNTGVLTRDFDINLKIDGGVVNTQTITLAGGASETVTFSVTRSQAGSYDITIGDESGTLTVIEGQVTTTTTTTQPVIKPAEFVTSDLSISPLNMKPGDTATVSVTVTNIGGKQGTYLVLLKVNGVTEDSRDVTLASGDSELVNFTITKDQAGTYSISIDNLSNRLIVQLPQTSTSTTPIAEPEPSNWPVVVGGIISGLLGLALAFLVWKYIKRTAVFNFSGMAILPPVVKPGEAAKVIVKVTNNGNKQGSYNAVLKVNDNAEDSKEINLDVGKTETVEFSLIKTNPGIYIVSIDRISSRLIVQEPSTGTGKIRPRTGPDFYR